MERTTPRASGQARGGGILGRLREALSLRQKNKEVPIYDLFTLIISFLFARCHVIFGAHPLSLGFVAALPTRIWIATVGAVLGSLTLGKSGVIYAMISVIVVFLRVIISGTSDKDEGQSVFGESVLLRMSSSVIGGFIAAVYEVLLSGFTLTTVAFGVSMILLPPLSTLGFSGLFDGPDLFSLFTKDARVLSLSGRTDKKKGEPIFYQASALFLVLLISLSLSEYNLLGISAAYIFSPAITLAASRRFGSLRGAATGFVSSLCLSPVYAAAFALLGLVAGILFKLGATYALIGGGAAVVGWCAYAGGVSGVLSTLPEYLFAALVSVPFLKRIDPVRAEAEGKSAEKEAKDMVGTMSLSYKSKRRAATDALAVNLTSLASIVRKCAENSEPPSLYELRSLIRETADRYIQERTQGSEIEGRVDLPEEIVEKMSKMLLASQPITEDAFEGYPSFDNLKGGIVESVNRAVAILNESRFRAERDAGYAEFLELVTKLLSEARLSDDREKSSNDYLREKVESAMAAVGLEIGCCAVYGERRPHIIIAAEDESGRTISSPELKDEIEERTGLVLGSPDFYRRASIALLECSAAKRFSVSAAFSGIARGGEEISGDTVRLIEGDDGVFGCLICDGVGTGKEARRASDFVSDFISTAFCSAIGNQNIFKLVNHIIRKKGEEFISTADLFSFDSVTGDAYFYKSGAASSYIKRASSIFRIRSRTAALGALKGAECERIKAQVEAGDLIIMMSDGVATEDTAWLIELLAGEPEGSLKDYADLILYEAKRRFAQTDDMTVAVVRIS